ncbi:MAG: hypothetical protein H6556_09990 [Lewinellaceae bacterium]|nr:hypothetical protein [Lewinellaceae bacterium]
MNTALPPLSFPALKLPKQHWENEPDKNNTFSIDFIGNFAFPAFRLKIVTGKPADSAGWRQVLKKC